MGEYSNYLNTPKEVMRQFQRRALNSAISMLNEEQGKAFTSIIGKKDPFDIGGKCK